MSFPSSSSSSWIVDAHTHVLPDRLAAKIRAFFEQSIAGHGDPNGSSADQVSSSLCCKPRLGLPFEASYEDEDSFPHHPAFKMPYSASSVPSLAQSLHDVCIGSCWTLPYAHKAGMSQQLNETMLKVTEALHNEGIAAVAGFTVHPEDGAAEVLRIARTAVLSGARVAKLHCSVGSYTVLDERLAPFWKLCAASSIPAVVHRGKSITGNTSSPELEDMKILLSRYPSAPIILAHSGAPAVRDAVLLATGHSNLFLDTTPVVTRLVGYPNPDSSATLGPHSPQAKSANAVIRELAQQGRILLGTDLPNVAVPLERTLVDLIDVFGSPEERKLVQCLDARAWRDWCNSPWAAKAREDEGCALHHILAGAARKLIGSVRTDVVQRSAEWDNLHPKGTL